MSQAEDASSDTGRGSAVKDAPLDLPPRMMADMVVYNGKVVAMDDPEINTNPGTVAEAMAVRDGEILELTSNEAVQKWIGSDTTVIDVDGRTVTPGIIDPHSHLQQFTARQLGPAVAPELFERQLIPVRGDYDSPQDLKEDIVEKIKAKVEEVDDGDFIAAIGLPPILYSKFPDRYEEVASIDDPDELVTYADIIEEQNLQPYADEIMGEELTTEDLNELAPNNPVLVGVHPNYIQNDLALDWCEEQYGVHPEGETKPPGFTLYRCTLFDVFLGGDVDRAIDVIKAGQEVYLMNGVTTYATHIYPPTALNAFMELDRRGEMAPRMAYGQTNYNFLNPKKVAYHKRLHAMRGSGSDFLWNTGVSVESMDAGPNAVPTAMDAPPEVKAEEFDDSFTGGQRGQVLEVIAEKGARFATSNHAVGDRTIDGCMDLIEAGSERGGLDEADIRERMHALDHGTTYPRPDQIDRLKRLGLRLHLNVWESWRALVNWNFFDKYPEEEAEKAKGWMSAAKTALDAGLKVGGHGKELENPFRHIGPHVTRTWEGDEVNTDLAIDRVKALKMYTTWNAEYLLRDDLGSLEPGNRADFIVLDRDYFEVPEDEIQETTTLLTVVDGDIHHDTGDVGIA